jgi:undecaprenyl pyrophosphate synthase
MGDNDDINSLKDADMSDINKKISDIERELRDTRDMARDTLHIAIGVDGNNGLRSAIKSLADTVEKIKEDFLFLRETAHNYRELKALILRFLFTGSFAFLFQLGGVVWFFSADHKSNENLNTQVREIASDIKQIQKENMSRDIIEHEALDKLNEVTKNGKN